VNKVHVVNRLLSVQSVSRKIYFLLFDKYKYKSFLWLFQCLSPFKGARDPLGNEFELVCCTKESLFDSHSSSLGKLAPGSLVILAVLAVLANIIVDACQGIYSSKVPLFAGQQITAHVESLSLLLVDNPEVNVLIVPPLRRTVPGI
jgi:hypothetical protein